MAAYEADKTRFERLNAHVMGISTDPVPSKVAWARSLGGISFDFLSDFYPHGAVSELYGVLRPEGFPVRAIFVVDKDGRIAWIKKYDIGEHPETRELLGELARLVEGR